MDHNILTHEKKERKTTNHGLFFSETKCTTERCEEWLLHRIPAAAVAAQQQTDVVGSGGGGGAETMLRFIWYSIKPC